MLRIAVCGENPQGLEALREMISSHPDTELVEAFADADALLQYVRSKRSFFHVVFISIQVGGGGMFNYAEMLYDLAPQAEVIFVSSLDREDLQRVLLRRIRLLGYLAEPVDRELLFLYLDKAVRKRRERQFFSFSSHGKQYSLELGNILYLESHNHVITVHAIEADLSFYGKLSSLNLPEYFVQCHKSYLVNLQKVTVQRPTELVMVGGAVVPISRSLRESTQAAIRSYREHSE